MQARTSAPRRRTLRLLSAAALTGVLSASPAALAQPAGWPDKPIKLMVGFPAGGASDVMARFVAERLGAALGQAIVVENKPGAAGTLAASLVAKALPDGYTLVLASPSAITLAPTTMAGKISYDPVKDLAPISQVNRYPLILLATPSLGVVGSGVAVGAVTIVVAFASLAALDETFARDLDFLEE